MDKLLKVKNIVIDVKKGKEYHISLRNPSGKSKNSDHLKYRPFEGILIQDTLNHLTFRNIKLGYSESFLKVDFAINHYLIREKSGKLVDVSY